MHSYVNNLDIIINHHTLSVVHVYDILLLVLVPCDIHVSLSVRISQAYEDMGC